ncbi:MAG: AlbA family DNA-binding domain-containing protein [Candidatus Binataceae bacterium]
MGREFHTINQIDDILSRGAFDEFVGVDENEIFEAKEETWNLEIERDKAEFAKDVTAFANSRGGVIIIAAQTGKLDTISRREVQRVRRLPVSLKPDEHRFNRVLDEWVYPKLKDDDGPVRWHPDRDDKTKGIIGVHIDVQPGDQQPFLVKNVLRNQAGKSIGWFFGIAERSGAETRHWPMPDLHTYLRNGRAWDPIVQRIDALRKDLISAAGFEHALDVINRKLDAIMAKAEAAERKVRDYERK